MGKSTSDLQLVLIQVRETANVARHEQECFLERCRIDPQDMKIINLVETPHITWDQVAACDAVIIGGAAAHTATKDYEFTGPFEAVVQRLVERGHPIFGSCWGHHFIARALGGEVIADRDNEEVGTFAIHLTAEAHADPLFADFPQSFLAHMGHHDRISRLPSGAVELAYSARCRNQMFRLSGKLIYGSQFHAEMSAQRLVERLSFYRDSYMPSEDEFESLRQNPLPTPEADRILHRFLEQIT